MVKQKTHAKIDEDVIERLHQYRIKNLGRKATLSDAIKELLEVAK